MTPEDMIVKMKSFSHSSELLTEQTTNVDWIKDRIRQGKDIFEGDFANGYRPDGERLMKLVELDLDNFPAELVNNR